MAALTSLENMAVLTSLENAIDNGTSPKVVASEEVYDKASIKCNGRKGIHKLTGILVTIVLSCCIPLGMAEHPPNLKKENHNLTQYESGAVAVIGCLSAMAIAIGLGHALRRCFGDFISQRNQQRFQKNRQTLERICDYAVAANIAFCFFGNSCQTKFDLHLGRGWFYMAYLFICLSFIATGCVVISAIYLHGRLRHLGRENYFSTINFGINSAQFFLSTLEVSGEPTFDRFFLPFLTAACDFFYRVWGSRNQRNRTEESGAGTQDRRQSGGRIDEEEGRTSVPPTLTRQNSAVIETTRLEELESQLTQLQEDLERAKEQRNAFESQCTQLQEDLKWAMEQRNSFESLKEKAEQVAEETKNQLKDMSQKFEDSKKQLLEKETQLQKLNQLQKDLERYKEQANSSESLKVKAQQDAEEAKNQLKDMSEILENSQTQLLEKEIQLLVILEEMRGLKDGTG